MQIHVVIMRPGETMEWSTDEGFKSLSFTGTEMRSSEDHKREVSEVISSLNKSNIIEVIQCR